MPPPIRLIMHRLRPDSLSLVLVFTLLSGLAWAASPLERPEIFPDEEELVLEKGTSLNLTCRASQPVAWCSHIPFSPDLYEEIYEEGNDKPYTSILTIPSTNFSHVGYFSCVFNTTENRNMKNCDPNDPSISSIYLFVRDLETLLVPPEAYLLVGIVGEEIVMPCKPTFPEVTVTLTRNIGEPEPCDDCLYDKRVGFTFRLSEKGQSVGFGFVSCNGTYANLTDTLDIHISLLPKVLNLQVPTVSVDGAWQEDEREENNDLSVYYVVEGSHINLTCTSNDAKEPFGYRLMWNDKTHLNGSGTHRTHRLKDSDRRDNDRKKRYYEIQNVRPEDAGVYECWPTVLGKKKPGARLKLNVISKDDAFIIPTIYSPNVTVKEVKVTWEVIYIAYPEPEFRWKKDGKVLCDLPNPNSRYQHPNYKMEWNRLDGILKLELRNPKPMDNGEYTIEASLPDKNVSNVTTISLMIQGNPENVILQSNKNKKMYKEKEEFRLQCSAEGYPEPNITLVFTPNDTPSISNGDGAPEESRVYNQVEEDNVTDETGNNVLQQKHWKGVAEHPGWYRCIASNKHGNASSEGMHFLLTDGESDLPISLELLIEGEKQGSGKGKTTVPVVEGDNISLTCRANKLLAKPPLTWKLDNLDAAHTELAKKAWGMEVFENETHLSFLSTVRAPSLARNSSNVNLTCSDGGGNHTYLTFLVQKKERPRWKTGKAPKKEYVKNNNGNLSLSCLVEGTPRPTVIWRKGDRILEVNHKYKLINENQTLFLPILVPADNGGYSCEVFNRVDKLRADFNVMIRDPEGQMTAIILGVVGFLIVALVVLSVFFCRKIYQARKETLNLQLREQKLFLEGDPSSLNPEISLEQQAELLPYNNKYEVSRDSIIFDKLLGAGAFGRVYRATALNLLPGEARTTVAVKMMKSRTDSAQLKALRSEVKIMIHIGRHINIVNLLGACSKDLASKGELLLLVEYCRYGNILDYMRRHRREFVNQINDEDKIDPAFCIEPRPRHRSDSSTRSHGTGLKYAHLSFHKDNVFYSYDQASDGDTPTPTSLAPPPRFNGEAVGSGRRPIRARTVSASSGTHQIASDNSLMPPSETSASTSDGYLSAQSLMGAQAPLSSMDILGWAYQIAKGMEYLAFKKVLHGDLAARNVLLSENNVVKISDFGLAKDIYKNHNYKRKSEGPVPVKWLAVECLRDGVFSTQSDVWSFGVVLWEIFSLGQVPYSCTEFDESFIHKLEKGVRLEQPRYATYGLYRLMLECWDNDPMQRPSFTNLEASLGEMLGEAQRQNYIQLTEPYQQENTASEYLDLLPSQDYSTKVSGIAPQLTEDGYEMPFSPGMAPQQMVTGDRQSMASPSRLTTRQIEYIQTAAEDSAGSYLPMSADRTDHRTVFDFDKETVACLIGRPDEQEAKDAYLPMDKITPQQSPGPNTPNGIDSKSREESPRRLVLKSVSSFNSQGGGRHRSVRKHDSGVYSPTVMAQTNPDYMGMIPLMSADDQNHTSSNMDNPDGTGSISANTDPAAQKPRNYLADGSAPSEYVNLLPQKSSSGRTISESSSGVDSFKDDSPPRERGGSVFKAPPTLQETMVV